MFAFTTLLCAAIIATGSFGGAAAFAEESGTGIDYYPQDFSAEVSFENLRDYDFAEDKILFLDGDAAYEYSGERLLKLDTVPEFNGYTEKDKFSLGNFYYSFNGENVLTAYNELATEPHPLAGFSLPKKYGDKAYAVKDNALYELKGTDTEKVPLPYLDFTPTLNVNTGDAANTVKEFSIPSPTFVTVKEGAFVTGIDIDALGEARFAAGETHKTDEAFAALLLATCGTDGKISVITLCGTGKSYILHSDDVSVVDRQAVSETNLGATVTVDDAYIYSAPYVCKSTQLAPINAGDIVKVTGEVTKDLNPELARDFYKVEFKSENGGTISGYVPYGYVSPYEYNEKPPVETPDPDGTEENLIKPVVLIIVVIALVLIAAGYLIFVATGGKNKKNKKR